MKNHLSEEILDILNESPRLIVRMGATVILFLVCLILAGAWFIRYPEVLKGNAVISTESPTMKIVAEKDGQLVRLLLPNGAIVRKGDVLAEMENRTRLENTVLLQSLLTQTQAFLANPSAPIHWPDKNLSWGELQTDVMALNQQYEQYQLLRTDHFHRQQMVNLKQQLGALQQMQLVHQRKKSLGGATLNNVETAYQADQKLFAEGIYSRTEFQKSENNYLGQKREQEDLQENLLKNNLKMVEIEAEIRTLEFKYLEQQRNCLTAMQQAAQNIENGLRSWQQQYLLIAPSDGKLTYLQNIVENQFVKSGEILFSIIPEQQQFVAVVDISVRGMGKAAPGQKVVLKLADYPYQEFGTLEGQVLSMAPAADLGKYRIMVTLPKGLQSSYHHSLQCKSEMTGTAEIITEDMRLFERAFYGIRKLVM